MTRVTQPLLRPLGQLQARSVRRMAPGDLLAFAFGEEGTRIAREVAPARPDFIHLSEKVKAGAPASLSRRATDAPVSASYAARIPQQARPSLFRGTGA